MFSVSPERQAGCGQKVQEGCCKAGDSRWVGIDWRLPWSETSSKKDLRQEALHKNFTALVEALTCKRNRGRTLSIQASPIILNPPRAPRSQVDAEQLSASMARAAIRSRLCDRRGAFGTSRCLLLGSTSNFWHVTQSHEARHASEGSRGACRNDSCHPGFPVRLPSQCESFLIEQLDGSSQKALLLTSFGSCEGEW